ncbi:hypothetical protein [Tabrizicola sp.]|nr:hypothetical protein [Tabrizicola sp.]
MPRLCPFVFLVLAACGADGAPQAPASKSGITISGDTQIGVVLK